MIAGVLSSRLIDVLRRAGVGQVYRLPIAERGIASLRVTPGDLLIVDPVELRNDELLTKTLAAALRERGVRCAFFTEFSPDHMRAVGLASPLNPLALWIAGIDDASPAFRHRVLRLAGHQVVLDTLDRLQPAIDRLPWRLSTVIAAVFSEPERFFDACDIGRAAQMSRRSVDRHLVGSGFTTASRVIVAAKLLHAAARLQCGGTTVGEVAEALGYSAHEVLARQCVRVLGCRPSELASYPHQRLCIVIATFICPQVAPPDDVTVTPVEDRTADAGGVTYTNTVNDRYTTPQYGSATVP